MRAVSDAPEPLTHGFLLIEPASLDRAPALKALDACACTPRVLAHREELMPRLIGVGALDESARTVVTDAWFAEIHTDKPPAICAWLDCDLDRETLARHIARYLVGPGVDGRPTLWRYYDPRVLSLVLAVVDPAQRQALLGPMRDWRFAWAGHRWNITGPGRIADLLDGHEPAWPRPEQWPRIDRSHAAVLLLDRLPALSAETAARLPAEFDRLFCDATRHNLAHTDDLVDYAWHCLRYGEAFERHPTLTDARAALIDGQITWPAVVARFTPDDFRLLERASPALNP